MDRSDAKTEWLARHLAGQNVLPVDRKLCGILNFRGRICAADRDHEGAHNFVPRTVRED